MAVTDVSEQGSEKWIVEAGRELDPPASDVERLTAKVIDSARRLSHSRSELATDRPSIVVTDRVVRRVLMMEIRRRVARPVLEVGVTSEEREVTGVRLGLMCRYDDDLGELADDVRGVTADVLAATLGAERGARAASRVDVDWMDLDWTPPSTEEKN
ncbi:hypothetical protein [Williamsia sp. M5A3_1d]